ncbi:MAG: hypothetical protein M0P57_09605 [Syntrophales bacterium]|jgi:hypothetical protein|nr:hypothetical protein [Syntrophales bacterium]MDY0045092.1 hypothetical protein [Syntrophales bacterium]
MEVFADKLINITRHNAEAIAEQWAKSVSSNPRTPSYHSIPIDTCKQQAVDFYKNLRAIYFSEKPYDESVKFFTKFAEDRYSEGIPLSEAVYILILIRRHLWLFADFRTPFLAGLDIKQKVGAINTTIRIFDHGIFIIIKKYDELEKYSMAPEQG